MDEYPKEKIDYEKILENLNDIVYVFEYKNTEFVPVYYNSRLYSILEIDREKKSSLLNWIDFVADEDIEKVKKFLLNLCSSFSHSHIEHRILTSKNEIRHVSNVCYSIYGADNDAKLLYGTITDISQYMDIINKSNYLARAVEESPASVVITDVNGNIEYVNHKFTQLTGYSFSEVIGKNPRILKSGVQTDEYYKELWEAIISGNNWTGEFHNKKKDGSMYWEFASISPLKNKDGKISKFLAVKEDITELKNIQERLQISENELRIKNEAYEKELIYAQHVQKTLLPVYAPEIPFIEIKYVFKPLEVIGGDFFSFYKKENGICVFVADVSGHGVPAALFLSLLKYLVDMLIDQHSKKPDTYLNELNTLLCKIMFDHFITAFYGYFEFKEGKVKLYHANGGHPPVIVYKKLTSSVEAVRVKGSILGMFENMEYV